MFCTETKTLAPLFGQRPRLSSLFDIIKKWFQGLGEEFPYDLFIFRQKYCVQRTENVHTLVNFLSGSAKLAVWLTRTVPEGFLKTRLRVEHSTICSLLSTHGQLWCSVLCREWPASSLLFFEPLSVCM